jgi:hypothetical protein
VPLGWVERKIEFYMIEVHSPTISRKFLEEFEASGFRVKKEMTYTSTITSKRQKNWWLP